MVKAFDNNVRGADELLLMDGFFTKKLFSKHFPPVLNTSCLCFLYRPATRGNAKEVYRVYRITSTLGPPRL